MKIRINQYNKDLYIKTLTEGLQRFISYCNDYTDNKQYNNYKSIAESLLNGDYNNIGLNILEFCFNSFENISNTTIYPEKMLHALYDFSKYAYNNNGLLSIQDQQLQAKKYVHFDFSMKRPKTLKDI